MTDLSPTTGARARGAALATHRDAVLGVRQLGHPVQGVRAAGRARATRTRRSPTRRRCTASPGVAPTRRAAHPVGPGRRLRRAARSTPPTWASRSGTINANVFQDDDYMLGSVTNPDPRVRRKAIDHLLECVDIMDATGSRDLKLWFSDGTNYPGQDDIRARQDRLAEALARDLRPARRRPAAAAGVQAVRARVLHHGRPGLGHVVRALPRARRPRRRSCVDTGHHAPGTNIEFIVAILLRAGQARGVRLQLPLLRRRRPDGRVGRPVPAVPDHVRGRPRRRARRRTPASRSCSTSATTSSRRSRPDPVGDERPGGDGQGAARRRRRAGGGAGDGRRARRERRADGRLQHRRPAAARRAARRSMGLDPDPMAAYAASGYAERIVADRVGGAAGRVGRLTVATRGTQA